MTEPVRLARSFRLILPMCNSRGFPRSSTLEQHSASWANRPLSRVYARQRWRRSLRAGWAILVGVVIFFAATAGAQSAGVVNSTDDDPDAFVGDGVCDTGQFNGASQPECTLRAAIQEANAATAPSTITFNVCNSNGSY